MDQPVAVGGGSLRVSASIGIAYAARVIGAGALMAAADRALYAAKEAGRNTWRMAAADAAAAPGANPGSPAARSP